MGRAKKCLLDSESIISLYRDGTSPNDIALLANVSSRYINLVLSKHNVEKRPFGYWKRKYTLNEHYFKTWNNNMAYILGFFLADGNVSPQCQSITISQKDPTILLDIQKELNSNIPLFKNEKTGVHLLCLNSKIMRDDIMHIHKILPAKSFNATFPNVPAEYMSHFIRGYFDGDGHVNYPKYIVSFVGGSVQLMEALMEILQKQNLNPYISVEKTLIRVFITGRKTIRRFAGWIYEQKGLHLSRKFELFQQETLHTNNLTDRKIKYTKEAVANRKQEFLKNYSIHKDIEMAFHHIGISSLNLKLWLEKDPSFEKDFNNIKTNSKSAF